MTWATTKAWLSGKWKLVTPALLVAIAIPLWQTYWVQTPDVHIEVTQVDRKPLDAARQVVMRADDSFRFLAEPRFMGFIPDSSAAVDIADVDRMVNDFERDTVNSGQERIATMQKQLDDLSNETVNWDTIKQLNDPTEEPEVTRRDFDAKQHDATYIADLVKRLKERLRSAVKTRSEALAKAKDNLARARERLKSVNEQLDKSEARVRVGAAVSNAGRGAISLRREGVLRVFLGTNNYIDVELTIDEYSQNADLQPKHSRIVTLSSKPTKELDLAAQERIRSYWGQNVPAKLFVTDIDGKIYASDTFPFAQGLYQQLIYDRLKAAAAQDALTKRRGA